MNNEEKLKPSQYAKLMGIKNLKTVRELSKQSDQTLINWCNDKPELFELVLLGCSVKLNIINELKCQP